MDRLTAPRLLLKPEKRPFHVMAEGEGPALDLTQRFFTQRTRGLEVIGSWVLARDGRTMEPCLVLLPEVRRVGQPITPCLITASEAWKWADAPLGDPDTAVGIAMAYAIYLGKNPDRTRDVIDIYEAVQSRLDDLHMAPLRKVASTTVAEVTGSDSQDTPIETALKVNHA